ncbi:MAG: sugar O-acetyltransferase [Candidatus Izemoplasmatales bacterium]
MSEKEKMLKGMLYFASDPELRKEFINAKRKIRLFNLTNESELDRRSDILRSLFKKLGEDTYIEPPFRCDYGYNISVGKKFYANYDCIMIDVTEILIGDYVMFGPRVSLYTAEHPIDPTIRRSSLEYGKPIRIGDNVWVGGDTVINGGVSIGEGTIIGSGSVVIKDIPENVIAAGNPCQVIREITAEDYQKWANLAAKSKQ